MDPERPLLHQIAQSLGGLSGEDLLILERLVWDTRLQMLSNAELKAKQFSAEFSSEQASEEKLPFDTIKQAIQTLNPAEIMILHDLIASHLVKARPGEKHISASWGTRNGLFSLGSHAHANWTLGTSSAETSSSPVKAADQFQEIMKLVEQAKAVKATGDQQNASSLIEAAIEKARQAGIPDFMLERLRELYL